MKSIIAPPPPPAGAPMREHEQESEMKKAQAHGDREGWEKYLVVLEDAIAYARRHALYPDHPDLTTADFAIRQLRERLAAAGEALDGMRKRVLDFTGAPTIDEAMAIIIWPVEWDALASYHGIAITGATPTPTMVERAARAMFDVVWAKWGVAWEGARARARVKYLTQARAALTAALSPPADHAGTGAAGEQGNKPRET